MKIHKFNNAVRKPKLQRNIRNSAANDQKFSFPDLFKGSKPTYSNLAWYGMVWYGMVWNGMVWYGMVWYGMAWYGIVQYSINVSNIRNSAANDQKFPIIGYCKC